MSLREQLTAIFPTDPERVQQLLELYNSVCMSAPRSNFHMGCFIQMVKKAII